MARRLSLRRVVIALVLVAVVVIAGYSLWSPGVEAPLPKNPHNGAWLTHAWWGDAAWFEGSVRQIPDYHGEAAVRRLAVRLHALGIDDWYVHACPAAGDGSLPAIDDDQARLLVSMNAPGQVLAWVGGVLDEGCEPSDPNWRAAFARNCADLVRRTGIAGIQLNIEPCPSFAPGYLELLEELRRRLPAGARLSVAAYPPPSLLHPYPEVHWDERFYKEVASRSDDLCVMAYDTGWALSKPYTWLVETWSTEAMAWSQKPVRIGLPAYDNEATGYHHPTAENLASGFPGLVGGIGRIPPPSYAGWAVYAEWTLGPGGVAVIKRFQP